MQQPNHGRFAAIVVVHRPREGASVSARLLSLRARERAAAHEPKICESAAIRCQNFATFGVSSGRRFFFLFDGRTKCVVILALIIIVSAARVGLGFLNNCDELRDAHVVFVAHETTCLLRSIIRLDDVGDVMT